MTEDRFRELLPRAESAGDPDYHAALLSQIARTLGLRGRFGKAHALLDRAEALDPGPLARGRCRIERGRACNSAGEPARAMPLFEEAFELARAAGDDHLAIDAAHMLAIAGAPPQQIEWAGRALELVERTTCERARRWAGPLYNNLGWTHHEQGRFAEALDCFERGLALRETQGEQEPIFIARWTVARVLRSLGRLTEALERQQALLDARRQAGAECGYVHEELGECLLALDRAGEARPHFARAHELLAQDEWLARNEPERLTRLAELGEA